MSLSSSDPLAISQLSAIKQQLQAARASRQRRLILLSGEHSWSASLLRELVEGHGAEGHSFERLLRLVGEQDKTVDAEAGNQQTSPIEPLSNRQASGLLGQDKTGGIQASNQQTNIIETLSNRQASGLQGQDKTGDVESRQSTN